MLGTGDVDYMDYNISYFTIGYLGSGCGCARPVRVSGHSGHRDHHGPTPTWPPRRP